MNKPLSYLSTQAIQAVNANQTFIKAVKLLSHPAVLLSIIVLLVNDHFLRILWPSWFTGKIGDFVWLLFAPFALAAVISWCLPRNISKHEQWTFNLSFGFVSGLFVMMKVVPGFNVLATRILSEFLLTSFVITVDPSDLITLPALAVSAFLWKMPSLDQPRSWHAGLVALPLAALLTIANSGIPDPGIACFHNQDNQIIAQAGYSSFISEDGGKTWLPGPMGMGQVCQIEYPIQNAWMIAPGSQANISYRYLPGRSIEVSTDSGSNWKTIRNMDEIPEAQKQYYIRSIQGYAEYSPGPLDAVADNRSGNMLFAMGHQGVLILNPNGEWEWSSVGDYRPLENFPNFDAFGLLLGGTLLLAVCFGLLVFVTLALGWAGGPIRITILVITWITWLLVIFILHPAVAESYGNALSNIAIFGILVIILALSIEQTVRVIKRRSSMLLSLLGFALLGTVLFFLPYLLWLYSTLPSILWATFFGVAVGGMVLVVGILFVRKQIDFDHKKMENIP